MLSRWQVVYSSCPCLLALMSLLGIFIDDMVRRSNETCTAFRVVVHFSSLHQSHQCPRGCGLGWCQALCDCRYYCMDGKLLTYLAGTLKNLTSTRTFAALMSLCLSFETRRRRRRRQPLQKARQQPNCSDCETMSWPRDLRAANYELTQEIRQDAEPE